MISLSSRAGGAATVALALAASLAAGCGGGGDDGVDPGPPPWVDPGTPEQFLADEVMPELELRIDAAEIQQLEANPRTYVPATIVYRGASFGPVGVRLKGQNSFLPFSQKPSLRVNINEFHADATFYGLKDLTLNNMSTDHSMVHERLAYMVARAAGLPASRANHALLTINGEFYGVYANVETVKGRMIDEHFEDGSGALFEATDVDFTPQLVGGYELENGPDDRLGLEGLANALTMPDATQALAAAGAFLDISHFQRYWAMSTIIGQFDAFPYSLPGDDYFVYADPASGKLWFLPWGMDETFLSGEFPPMMTNSILAAKCQAAPACRQGYIDQVWELLAMTEAMNLEGERLRVQAEIAPHVARDMRKPYGAAEVTEGQTQLGYFIRGRRELLTRNLPPPSP